ncbi:MAG: hypothetical protein ABL949_07300 [Fimbriimonadaceae bacterium]
MNNSLNPNLDRRTFLRGATTAIGASAVASSGLAALAPVEAVASVAMIEGDNLIPGEWLTASKVPLERVQITIESRGAGKLTGLTAVFGKYPFQAWTAGGGRCRFEMPVGRDGITLILSQGEVSSKVILSSSGKTKLREGNYALAAGRVNWKLFRAEAGKLLGAGGNPTSLQHLIVTVERI